MPKQVHLLLTGGLQLNCNINKLSFNEQFTRRLFASLRFYWVRFWAARLARLRRTHTGDSTATFPLLQVKRKARHPVCCMWTRLMYPTDPPHTARAPENRVGRAGWHSICPDSRLTRVRRTHTGDSRAIFSCTNVASWEFTVIVRYLRRFASYGFLK